jgi:plasmid stabilization system protein ParE
MSRLIWSLQALQDLQRLKRFLADKNADAARRAVKAIRESVKVLAHPPGIGRPVEDMEPGVSGVAHQFRGQLLCGSLPLAARSQ